MFIAVYVGYIYSRNRELSPGFVGNIVGIVLLKNLRFPLIGAFLREVYTVVMIGRLMIARFVITFMLIRVIHMKLFYIMRRYVTTTILPPFLVLILLY